jgi:L-lactate dehydrogenase complex protein LldF
MAIKKGQYTFMEKQSMKLSTAGMKSRKLMNMVSGKNKNTLAKTFLKSAWGPRRDLPKFAAKSFNEQWKEKQGDGGEQP